jgi:hypothetical protein
VRELVDVEHWGEAEAEAAELARDLAGVDPVAGQSLDGLRMAVRARDRDDLQSFAELIEELFGR